MSEEAPAGQERYIEKFKRAAAGAAAWGGRSARDLAVLIAFSRRLGVLFVVAFSLLAASLVLLVANAVLLRYVPGVRPQAPPAQERKVSEAAKPQTVPPIRVEVEHGKEQSVWKRLLVKARGDSKAYPTLLEVDVIEERKDGAFVVTLEFHHWLADSGSGIRRVKLDWWAGRGLARSGAVIDIRPHPRFGMFMYTLDFPTTERALTSYVRTHWHKDAIEANEAYNKDPALKLKPEDLDRVVAAGLDRGFGNDLENARTHWAIVTLRIINGPIQWLTIAAFIALIVIIAARWWLFVRAEQAELRAMKSNRPVDAERLPQAFRNWLQSARTEVGDRDKLFQERWECRSIGLTIWSRSLDAAERSPGEPAKAVEAAKEAGDVEQAELDSRGFNLRYLIGALPALGFVGTVWGIADALMNVGGVLSAELAKQQSGVGAVALALSVAFDTTLVALVLALMGGYMAAAVTAAEEQLVLAARRMCQENIGSVITPEPQVPQSAPPPVAPPPPPRIANSALATPLPPPPPPPPDVEDPPIRRNAFQDEPDDYLDATDRPNQTVRTVVVAVLAAGILYAALLGVFR